MNLPVGPCKKILKYIKENNKEITPSDVKINIDNASNDNNNSINNNNNINNINNISPNSNTINPSLSVALVPQESKKMGFRVQNFNFEVFPFVVVLLVVR